LKSTCQLLNGGSAPATPGFSAVAPEWLAGCGAAKTAAPAIPAAESTLGSHPCVALSSAQVLPEWSTLTSSFNNFAANGDYPLNFVSHSRGSLHAQGVRPTRLSSIRDEALGRHEASDYMSSCARVANPRSSAPLGGGRGKNISSTGSIEDAGPRLLIPRGRLSAPVPSLTRGYNSVGGPAGARNSGDLVFLQPLAIGAQAANRLTTSHSNANPLVP
jgi:hypothetical protein